MVFGGGVNDGELTPVTFSKQQLSDRGLDRIPRAAHCGDLYTSHSFSSLQAACGSWMGKSTSYNRGYVWFGQPKLCSFYKGNLTHLPYICIVWSPPKWVIEWSLYDDTIVIQKSTIDYMEYCGCCSQGQKARMTTALIWLERVLLWSSPIKQISYMHLHIKQLYAVCLKPQRISRSERNNSDISLEGLDSPLS